MSNVNTNERFQDTTDAKHDDELSTDELDNVAGGSVRQGPAAVTSPSRGRAIDPGPQDAGDKGRAQRAQGPESRI